MEEYREQLEQLESYQSQELAKVKHMLLSAESELEAEKKKSLIQPIQSDTSEVSNKDDSIEDEAIARLKQENQVLQSKLVDVMSERDTMKANLLEVEIANHECDQAKVNEIDAFKIEIAKLQAEIETLNVTLKVRDGEIKAKKEDLKKEKVMNFKIRYLTLYFYNRLRKIPNLPMICFWHNTKIHDARCRIAALFPVPDLGDN